MNITKNDLATAIYSSIGLSHKEAVRFVSIVFENISDAIMLDGEAKIEQFGSFKKNYKKPRIGRNPKTMEEYEIKARNVVTFYPSKNFKNKIKS